MEQKTGYSLHICEPQELAVISFAKHNTKSASALVSQRCVMIYLFHLIILYYDQELLLQSEEASPKVVFKQEAPQNQCWD